jgi:hypothetical protein
MKRRSPIHRDLRTPKYKPRVILDKKRKAAKARKPRTELSEPVFWIDEEGRVWRWDGHRTE